MSGHRLDVQGLRAVAIFAVLLFHFYPQHFPNGFLGVDVFFVISGYLIFTIFSRNVQKNGLNRDSISNFYYRRLARIVPLSLFYICCAVLAYCYMSDSYYIEMSQKAAWKSLCFVTNIFAVINDDHYFARPLEENLFTHMWSLSVEVQYYLCVPLLFAIEACICGISRCVFYPLVIAASLVSYLLSPPVIMFNLMPNRLWQFLLITLFMKRILQPSPAVDEEKKIQLRSAKEVWESIKSRNILKTRVFEHLVYYPSFMLLSLSFFPFELPSFTRLIVTSATALVIVFGNNINNSLLSNRPAVFIGDISYSLYLFHWPFSVYLRSYFWVLDINYGIPLSLVTTIAVYHAFEKRYRKWAKKVVLISSFLLSLLAVSLIVLSPQINELMMMTKRTSPAKEQAIKENEQWFFHSRWTLAIERCNMSQWRNAALEAPFGLCTMPNGDGKLKFMVIGNSYAPNQAEQVYDAFRPYFSEFHIFSMPACEVLSYTNDGYCEYKAEFKDVLPDFQPDVVFIIQRYITSKAELPFPGEEDAVYNEMEKRLDLLYNMSSLFFIEDAFPAVNRREMKMANAMIRAGKSAEFINDVSISQTDDQHARTRSKKLMEYCGEKCHLFDIAPSFMDQQGRVQTLDGNTWLAIIEPGAHFTRHGKTYIVPLFQQLAEQYEAELRRLGKRLYPRN